MNRRVKIPYVLLSLILHLAGCNTLRVVENQEGFLVLQGRDEVLFYQRNPKFADVGRPRNHYVHPLYGLQGEILTEDMPTDHPHHRGIFWAWHQLFIGEMPVGDSWTLEDFFYDIDKVDIIEGHEHKIALKSQVYWKSRLWTDPNGTAKPFVKETSTIRLHRASEGRRIIDFEISLLALVKGVRIGGANDAKGYGGFSARIKLPPGITFTSGKGLIVPQRLAVRAGPWMDFSGTFSDKGNRSGLTIYCHRTTPHYPQAWILRKDGSMQNAVFPGRHPIPLSCTKPLSLRYRLIIYKGDTNPRECEKQQQRYDSEVPLQN